MGGGYVCGDEALRVGGVAGAEGLGSQRVSGIWGGYVGVLLWVIGAKCVSSYRGGARKMNVLAKDYM